MDIIKRVEKLHLKKFNDDIKKHIACIIIDFLNTYKLKPNEVLVFDKPILCEGIYVKNKSTKFSNDTEGKLVFENIGRTGFINAYVDGHIVETYKLQDLMFETLLEILESTIKVIGKS